MNLFERIFFDAQDAAVKLPYRNRRDAGRVLAESLQSYRGRADVLVLALPRGGAPVAAEVAMAIDAPLDLLVVRKLGVPGHEEMAMGAIATGGAEVLNRDFIGQLQIPDHKIEAVRRAEQTELARREAVYRSGRPSYGAENRCVIIIDDGIATGSTIEAAIQSLRSRNPKSIIIAVPVSPPDALKRLRPLTDEIICPVTPDNFRAVGQWYSDFSQTDDEEVCRIMSAAWQGQQN